MREEMFATTAMCHSFLNTILPAMSPDTDEARHPFLKGLSKHRGAPPTVVVIFGASGDLTARKLVPAIFNLGVDIYCRVNFI